MTRHITGTLALVAALTALPVLTAQADPFCCECKDGKKHLLDESNIAVATTKCSLKCKRATVPQKGACEAPPAPSATAPVTPAAPSAAPATAKAAAGALLLYRSEDCSGDAMRLEQSNAQLAEGYRSYQVDSGRVTAHAKANFGGAATQPVVGSMCVSPGWSLGSVRISN